MVATKLDFMPWSHTIILLFCCTLLAHSYDDHHFRSPILLTNVGCNGSENNLTSCCSTAISSRFYCFNRTYAGVRCMQVDWELTINSNIILIWILQPGSQCIEYSLQLIGELSQQAGLPVICLGGRWGKICDFLDTPAAVVVCRQLGFSTESNLYML